ncbi:hypothetical protein AVEN_186253-1, partial [Araneus ventricosus]
MRHVLQTFLLNGIVVMLTITEHDSSPCDKYVTYDDKVQASSRWCGMEVWGGAICSGNQSIGQYLSVNKGSLSNLPANRRLEEAVVGDWPKMGKEIKEKFKLLKEQLDKEGKDFLEKLVDHGRDYLKALLDKLGVKDKRAIDYHVEAIMQA